MDSLSSRSRLYVILLLIPVFTFGAYVWANAMNVPYNDDEALLFTINYIHEHSSGLFKSLIQQHNDHRIFFSRLAGVVIDFLYGKMNFRTMIIFGYINLILVGHSFYLIYRSFGKNLLLFLPVSIVLFSPIVYCTQLWSITAFEQTLSIAFSLYCLYFLQPEKRKTWLWAIPLAVAATLANLDGVSVIPIALFWLITQRRVKESWIFGVFSMIYCYLFFVNFRFSSASQFPHISRFVRIVFSGFVALSGSIVKVLSDSHGYMMAVALGGVILLTYCTFTAIKYFNLIRKTNWVYSISLTEICFFKVLACVLMIAMGRSGENPENILSIRFQIYSASIFIMFYLFVLSNLKAERLQYMLFFVFLFGTLTLNLLAYVKYQDAVTVHNDELKVDAFNYPAHNFFIHQYPGVPDPKAVFYKCYDFPEYLKKDWVSRWEAAVKNQGQELKATFKSQILTKPAGFTDSIYPIINFEIGNLPSLVPRRNVYLALFNQENLRKPVLVALRPPNSGWVNKILKNTSAPHSFTATFPSKIPDGFYDIALCWTINNVPDSKIVIRNFKLEN
jgi:hypothetical protein